jgi:hypothetical protein
MTKQPDPLPAEVDAGFDAEVIGYWKSSAKYETKQELATKIDWEGGVSDAITGYGIKSCDLPDGTPLHVREAWERVEGSGSDIDLIQEWLEE